MKKILIIGSLLITIILIAGFFILIKSDSKQTIVTGQKEAEWATRELLRKRAEESLDTLVMGTAIEPGKWDFRGVTRQGESGLPVYGIVKLTCAKPIKKIRCWNLETLNRNGRDWRLADNAAKIRNASEQTLTPIKKNPARQTLQTDNNQKTPISAAQRPAQMVKKATSQPETFWTVKGRSVNGRTGPGTTFDITAKINPEIKLQLLEQQKGWGKFKILPPTTDAGKVVWIWITLTKKNPS